MAYPEPSIGDHNAPWNLVWDDDEEVWVCSCSECQRHRREEARQECLIDAYEDRKLGLQLTAPAGAHYKYRHKLGGQ